MHRSCWARLGIAVPRAVRTPFSDGNNNPALPTGTFPQRVIRFLLLILLGTLPPIHRRNPISGGVDKATEGGMGQVCYLQGQMQCSFYEDCADKYESSVTALLATFPGKCTRIGRNPLY